MWGYCAGLDMTRRDIQNEAKKTGRPWDMGKGFDKSAPMGALVPAAGIDPTKGKIELKVMARDDDGREATSIFRMFVGEEPAPEQKPQSRSSLSEKIRLAAKRPVPPMLVKPGDLTVQRKVVAIERAHAG